MRSLGVLWLIVFIGLMGFGITALPFPLVAEKLGASDFWKTFGGAGVFSLLQVMSAPLWGRYSDAYGRKPILVVSMAGSVLAYAWLAYADSVTSLILARAFGGIMSGNIAAAFAYATDVTDIKNRAKGLGIVSSAFGLGFAFGPLVGAYAGTGPDGLPSLFWPGVISAGLAVLAFVGTVFFLPESLPVESRKPLGVKDASGKRAGGVSPFALMGSKPVLLGLVLTALFISIGGAVMQSIYPFWARDVFNYQLKDLGPQFFTLAILSATGQLGFVGPMVKRFGEKRTALISVVGVTIGLVILALAAGRPWELWTGLVVFGLALGLFTPSITSLVSFQAEAHTRGAVMGAYQSAAGLGRIFGPALSGPVYFSLGTAAPFLLSAALSAIGGILLARVPQRKAAQPGAAPGQPVAAPGQAAGAPDGRPPG